MDKQAIISVFGREYVILLGPDHKLRVALTGICAVAVSIPVYLLIKNTVNEDFAGWSAIAITLITGLAGLTKRNKNIDKSI